jgi:hypothetical protein
VEEK